MWALSHGNVFFFFFYCFFIWCRLYSAIIVDKYMATGTVRLPSLDGCKACKPMKLANQTGG